jgi:hypothetical protein
MKLASSPVLLISLRPDRTTATAICLPLASVRVCTSIGGDPAGLWSMMFTVWLGDPIDTARPPAVPSARNRS